MANLFRTDLGNFSPFLARLDQAGLQSEDFERIVAKDGAPFAEAMVQGYRTYVAACQRRRHEAEALMLECGLLPTQFCPLILPEHLAARDDDADPSTVEILYWSRDAFDIVRQLRQKPTVRGARLRETLLYLKRNPEVWASKCVAAPGTVIRDMMIPEIMDYGVGVMDGSVVSSDMHAVFIAVVPL